MTVRTSSLLFLIVPIALALFVVSATARGPGSPADKKSHTASPFDLAAIIDVPSKGRIQDRDHKPHLQAQIDTLVAQGPQAVVFLISKLLDTKRIDHHVFDYWNRVHVGDVALVILCDLFRDPSGRSTIPGTNWDEILDRRDSKVSSYELLTTFVERHGRRELQRRWAAIWTSHRSNLTWDSADRCFRPRKARA